MNKFYAPAISEKEMGNMVKKKKYEGEMDKRIIEKKLLMGFLTESELESYLKSLPDLSSSVEELKVDEPGHKK
jgi:hypothetical protein